MEGEPLAVALKFGFLARPLPVPVLGRAQRAQGSARHADRRCRGRDRDARRSAADGRGDRRLARGLCGRRASSRASGSTSSAGSRSAAAPTPTCGSRTASPRHPLPRLTAAATPICVEDMNSTNGTFLNGAQLNGEAELCDLDEIRIGDTEFRFELGRRRRSGLLMLQRCRGSRTAPTPGASARPTRTPTSRAPRSSRSPTAWAAPRPGRSPRGSRSRPSSRRARAAAAPEALPARDGPRGQPRDLRARPGRRSRSGWARR